MRTQIIYLCSVFLILLCAQQASFCQVTEELSIGQHHSFNVDLKAQMTNLDKAPSLSESNQKSQEKIIALTMPNGAPRSFYVWENGLMSDDFKAQFPQLRTFSIRAVDDSAVTGRITISPSGLIVTIFTKDGLVEIAPVDMASPLTHRSTLKSLSDFNFDCGFINDASEKSKIPAATFTNGAQTRTYDLAIVTTGEYGLTHGSVPGATAAVTAMVGALENIYEKELAVKFNLLTPLIYLDSMNDPFPFTNSNRTLMAAEAIATNWPNSDDYDLGHVFHSQLGGNSWGGGVAFFGLCNDNLLENTTTGRVKAGAWSTVGTSQTDAVSLVAHEVGHQFYMSHSFNGTGGGCTLNISSDNAYEIGSGTTIMSYNGICGAGQNIPSSGAQDLYFHGNSLDQAIVRMNATSCPNSASSGNTPPTVNANPCGATYTIPIGTPFRLSGSSSDPDGDVVYYTWEQLDEDGAGTSPTQGFIGATAANSDIAPLFRSYPPNTSDTRYFPNKELIASNNYASDFEPLPAVSRASMKFRLTGRDMKTSGGGVHSSDISISVNANGPFALSSPNGGGSYTAGNPVTVTWTLSGIDFLNNINIKMSIDGGISFPYVLATNTPAADGMESVTIPAGAPNTSMARIMVESADFTCYSFFDISDTNFSITSNCNAGVSNICPTAAVSFPLGNPGLNLTMTEHYGGSVTKHNFTISAVSPTGPLANATVENGNICQTAWGDEKYSTFDFSVLSDGDYTFTNNQGGQIIFSIFTANGYNPANPCSSTFLGSNAWEAIGYGDAFTATLSACTQYKLVVWTLFDANASVDIDFTGPNPLLASNAGPGANYSYTYLAENMASGQVSQVSASSDFASLGGGTYRVYGASYYSGAGPTPSTVNPASWVGQSIAQVLSGGDCVVFSNNYRMVTVTGGASCMDFLTVNGDINTNTYEAGIELNSAGTVLNGANVIFRAGDRVILDPNFTNRAGGQLSVFIGPCTN